MILLAANNVCKSFFGNKAVDDVSLCVEMGSITGLIGPNGAGKTTLFNCIAGYYPLSSGKVLFEGREIQNRSGHALCRQGIARTFQIAKPFGDLTVLENVAIGGFNQERGRDYAFEEASRCLDFSGLADKAQILASLLNTGEQRKLELAKALACKPKLLLMDEVMAGLTPTESVEMVELIRKIQKQGITILMIEHIMPAVMTLSDTIYVMDRGKIIASGTPKQVSSDPRVIASYLGGSLEGTAC